MKKSVKIMKEEFERKGKFERLFPNQKYKYYS